MVARSSPPSRRGLPQRCHRGSAPFRPRALRSRDAGGCGYDVDIMFDAPRPSPRMATSSRPRSAGRPLRLKSRAAGAGRRTSPRSSAPGAADATASGSSACRLRALLEQAPARDPAAITHWGTLRGPANRRARRRTVGSRRTTPRPCQRRSIELCLATPSYRICEASTLTSRAARSHGLARSILRDSGASQRPPGLASR